MGNRNNMEEIDYRGLPPAKDSYNQFVRDHRESYVPYDYEGKNLTQEEREELRADIMKSHRDAENASVKAVLAQSRRNKTVGEAEHKAVMKKVTLVAHDPTRSLPTALD